MKKYDIFGIGSALVDTEILVTDDFLAEHGIVKGLMTLVDEERQDYLIRALREQTTLVKKACGGSACNSIVAASSFGADESVGQFPTGGGRKAAVGINDLPQQHLQYFMAKIKQQFAS